MPLAEKTNRHSSQVMDIASVLFLQNRTIFLTQPITDEYAADIVQQLMYLASVGNDDITMVIGSPGGSVTAGLAILDAMRGVPCDVSTVCCGCAASMGAFLLAAGTKGKRYAMPHAEVMLHQVMGGVQGQAVDVEIAANRISRMKRDLNSLLSEFTGHPVEQIQRDTDRDFFMTAKEAVAYGVVDGIRDTLI